MNERKTGDPVVIRVARIFDGARILDADTVVVRDGLIAEIGRNLAPPHGSEVVEASDATLLPGLVDAHTHTLAVADLEQALAFGVTTELDMFCGPDQLRALRKAAESRADVADIRSAGIGATMPDGHITQLVEMGVYAPFPTLSTPGEAPGFVAARVAEGSDYLKILVEGGRPLGWSQLPSLDDETLKALVDSAHSHDLPAVAHISTQADAQRCLTAGVDGLVHAFVDTAPDRRFVDKAAAAGIFVVPTLTVFEMLYGPGRREGDCVDHPRVRPYLSPGLRATVQAGGRANLPSDLPAWASAEHAHRATRALHEAGVPILAGTDVLYPPSVHGLSLHAELAALVDAGLTPAEALTAATLAPAQAFRLTDRGRITTGMRADLLLVEGDPTRRIAATTEIIGVWRAGHRFDRDRYRTTLDT
ncbi:putative amidohydrolase [Nocardia nova SH22a]|uniref:Putative amidohydrolase n=1 Tax=Nocardia nova SH22a TaxID=1415166 RepID=W5THW7_9NOCA|nr:amidohydrolase family protein [Nocardia nova]AHH18588.1 putative amidohydrolase [Nocardia nova SH22a]